MSNQPPDASQNAPYHRYIHPICLIFYFCFRAYNNFKTASYEDGAYELEDTGLLDRATELNRTLFTQDDDLLAEGARRQIANIPFCGIIYAHQLRVSIGRCVRDLELLAKAGEPDDLKNEIIFLPL